MPWLSAVFDPQDLFEAIERGYRLYVPSRPLFGAMSFALEEIFVRNADPKVRERARALSETVRAAFIAYHKERNRDFKEPPARAADDSLNVWVTLKPGEFSMGAEDITDDERPPHPVRVSTEFSLQQHEVTNEEYRRFDPTTTSRPVRSATRLRTCPGTRRPAMRHGWARVCQPRRSGSTRLGVRVRSPLRKEARCGREGEAIPLGLRAHDARAGGVRRWKY